MVKKNKKKKEVTELVPQTSQFDAERLLQSPLEIIPIMQQGINTQFWSILKYVMDKETMKMISMIRENGSDIPDFNLKLLIETLNITDKLSTLPQSIMAMAEMQKEVIPEDLDPFFKTFREMNGINKSDE